MIFGIDISSAQHPNGAQIDYAAAVTALRSRSGGAAPFVFVKLTEGIGYVNPFGLEDVRGFIGAGALVGAYCFDRPSASSSAEVVAFKATVAGALKVRAIDAEVTDGLALSAVSAHVAAVLAQDPGDLLYSYPSFLDNELRGEPYGHPLWLADPDHPAGSPSRPCLIHQYGQDTIPGIASAVDMNVWMGADIATFFGGDMTDDQISEYARRLFHELWGVQPSDLQHLYVINYIKSNGMDAARQAMFDNDNAVAFRAKRGW